MLATAYLPSAGINKLVFERVYGSNRALNSANSSDSENGSQSPHRERCRRHKHGRHRKSHRNTGSDAISRLQTEDSLMHLSTHSEGCTHLGDHVHDQSELHHHDHVSKRSGHRRQSSLPDITATFNSLNIKQHEEVAIEEPQEDESNN